MYHCDACGWDGDAPELRDDDFLFTLRCCPTCGEEVYEVVPLRQPRLARPTSELTDA